MDNKKNMFLLGAFFSLGILAVLSWTLFFMPSFGNAKKRVKVRSLDIQGILVGTPVTLAGKNVGKVSKITCLLDCDEPLKKHSSGDYYSYELNLKIDSSIKIFRGDEIVIGSSGLMGEKVINITPKGNRDFSNEISDSVLFASSTNLIQEFMHLSVQAKEILSKIFRDIDVCTASLTTTLSSVNELLPQLQLASLCTNITETSTLLNNNLAEMSQILNANKNAIHELIHNSSNVVADVRNYGFFFKYNKQWKKKEKLLLSEKSQENSSDKKME